MTTRIFIDGYGSIGKRHYTVLNEIYNKPRFEINDPNLGINSRPSGRYDIGVICTPTHMHIESALKLSESCDILFIEKPLHTSLQTIVDSKSIIATKNIHVGCNIRYTDAISRLREVSKSASILQVTAMSNLLKWRDDREKKAYSFHKSMGGGVLMDFIHEPDYIYSIFGLPNDVNLFQMRLRDDVTVDSDDSCIMNWKYDRLLVSFILSYCSNDYIRKVNVLMHDGSSEEIIFTSDDINSSYERQWRSLIQNGPQNTYDDCVSLYSMLLT